MKKLLPVAGAAAVLALQGPAAFGADSMSLMLNWTPTADHAPLYYAKSKGWYSEAAVSYTHLTLPTKA